MSFDYSALIRNLVDRSVTLLSRKPEATAYWRLQLLPEWVNETLPKIVPDEFIAFIQDDKEYSFVYYDAIGKVCGKPREIAAQLLTDLVMELVEETLEN